MFSSSDSVALYPLALLPSTDFFFEICFVISTYSRFKKIIIIESSAHASWAKLSIYQMCAADFLP
jgi:hypothetical protein